MSNNSNLSKAKKEKNDEFYTQMSDIENELKHYKDQLKDKVIFCNCDTEKSNFWKYFYLNFNHLGLKKLIATHFSFDKRTYKLEYNGKDITKTDLKQNGDFRSLEVLEILIEADIVITNPPFSLFREYVAQLIQYNKKFLIIGSMNAIAYKEIFKHIKDNKLWLGNNLVKKFKQPDGSIKKFGNITWFTNLETTKRHEELILVKEYNETDYPKYDNYDAINCDKTKDIPKDYYKVVGVPITFLDKYCPEQFEIMGQMASTTIDSFNFGYPYIDGKRKYARILIKRKGE